MYIVKYSFKCSHSLDMLKSNEIVPIYKKDDPLEKTNYRPVINIHFLFSQALSISSNSALGQTHIFKYYSKRYDLGFGKVIPAKVFC